MKTKKIIVSLFALFLTTTVITAQTTKSTSTPDAKAKTEVKCEKKANCSKTTCNSTEKKATNCKDNKTDACCKDKKAEGCKQNSTANCSKSK